MTPTELAHLSATELSQLIHSKEVSPVEVMEAALGQIKTHNDTINAVVTLSDTALDEARAAEKKLMAGDEVGPLLGLPAGIKDVTPVAGMRTTYGSTMYSDYVPAEDALMVTRLKQAGAIIVGKTNTPEFATGGNTFNDVFGVTRNPWNTERSVGGSTGGGAAALASGMIAIAEGTDLGGSLRIPASFCGIVGLRPSPGLVPTYPTEFPWDNMQVTGPMARTAADIALILQSVAGPSPFAPMTQPIAGRDFVAAVNNGVPAGTRIAYCPDIAHIGVEESVESLCRTASFNMTQIDATVTEYDFDLSMGRKPFLAIRGMWMLVQQNRDLGLVSQMGSNLAGNVRAGLELEMRKLGDAEHVRGQIWHIFRRFFYEFDYLLTPCLPIPPFLATQNYPETISGKKMKTYIDWVAPTFLLSLTGLPVACVPVGLTVDGLPVGLQIVGPPQGEEKVLALAHQIQKAHPIGLPYK
ncbi:MAG TPA: amidase family protein [Anaerolineae bacterium]|nr:amidase family protein [Anaerolineae bacterium]